MRYSVRRSLPVLVASLLTITSIAGAADVLQVPATRLDGDAAPPVLDGRVNDEAWIGVEPYTTFTQQDPNEGAPASERTEVRIVFDKSTVYVGIICFDSEPDKIIVNQSRRDADISETDSVIVVFDTFNDTQNAFVFGTNPLGIEYDGQVAGEGQASGISSRGSGTRGSQRGGINAFNANWDGDWRVRSSVTERGWETELAIPLKTLRYAAGSDRIWGFNVKRNIRRKNEQVFLSAIPRGSDVFRVSMAAKLTGLDLPQRRDLKFTPYVLGSANKDYTVQTDQLVRKGDVGLDVKWGIRPNLTADFTVNTDFAQVEADEEQVNLTRFDLFFPEKRPFFLENASMFQFGAPQSIDLFFSRRIGLAGGLPIDILGGARLSGKAGGYNVGVLNMQTDEAVDVRTGSTITQANNFGVIRLQREIGRSNVGAIFVNRQGTGSLAPSNDYNRAYGLDAAWQATQNGKVFAFLARTDSPAARGGSDYSGRLFYNYTNNVVQASGGYSQVGTNFNPEAGFLPRRGYRSPEGRVFLQLQPKRWSWIRRISPHVSQSAHVGLDGQLQTSRGHYHWFEIQPAQGGRFGHFIERMNDRPLVPFTVFNAGGRRVTIPPGLYTWWQSTFEYMHNPSARLTPNIRLKHGAFYDGDMIGAELDLAMRLGQRFIGSVGWHRQNIELPGGSFHTDLVPVKLSYAFTTLASLQALVQYNNQASLVTSNIRLALLNRSGTGLFVVFNDRRDTTLVNPYETLGRSFIVKYTRLFDF
ncbi:MAG: DUF5916 domain-containing protein [Vicinamibacterales bacterium]